MRAHVVALADALLLPLRNRYPVPTDEAVGQHVGVIVLGGALGHPDGYAAPGLLLWQTALREWLGIWVYPLTRAKPMAQNPHEQRPLPKW